MLKRFRLAAAIVGVAMSAAAPQMPAHAAVTVKAGVLTCHVDSGWGFVFGSSRSLRCTYSGGGRTEHYTGDISKFGVDIGYLQSGVIIWGIVAPTSDLSAGALAGDYAGVTAGAAVGVGAGANFLVGGFNHDISLQPLSIAGGEGLNVAAGVANISLKLQS